MEEFAGRFVGCNRTERLRDFELKRSRVDYITGELNDASARLTSANEHQICTLATFFTYLGRTISFLKDSPPFAWVFKIGSKCFALIGPREQCAHAIRAPVKGFRRIRLLLLGLCENILRPVVAWEIEDTIFLWNPCQSAKSSGVWSIPALAQFPSSG